MSQKTVAEEISNIVNKYDPIELLKIGCPIDEYSPEIKRIIPALQGTDNFDRFHNQVYNIFVEMFDRRMAGAKEKYRKMSEELYRLRKG